jgi:hypothetical protein
MVADAGFPELQWTADVMSMDESSLNDPFATKLRAVPAGVEGEFGEIVNETNCALVTAIAVDPVRPAQVALAVVDPTETPVARPETETEAMPGSAEVQETSPLRSVVLPSL